MTRDKTGLDYLDRRGCYQQDAYLWIYESGRLAYLVCGRDQFGGELSFGVELPVVKGGVALLASPVVGLALRADVSELSDRAGLPGDVGAGPRGFAVGSRAWLPRIKPDAKP